MSGQSNRTHHTTLAALNEPVSSEPTRIAVIADPHLSTEETGTSKVFHRTAERLQSAVEDCNERDVDAVLSVGDLTKDGAPWEYQRVDEILEALEAPFVAVPGNHDVPKAPKEEYQHGDDHEVPLLERFVEMYTPGELPFTMEIGGIDLIGLNTSSNADGSLRNSHEGEVTAEEVRWLDETLTRTNDPVVMMHHNTPNMYTQLREYIDSVHPEMSVPPETRTPEPLIDVLQKHEVPLVLTGHLHMPAVAETGSIREVVSPATCAYPQGYLLLDIDETGTVVRFIPITDIEGMSEAHAARRTGGDTAQGLGAFSAIRLACSPLIDDHAK